MQGDAGLSFGSGPANLRSMTLAPRLMSVVILMVSVAALAAQAVVSYRLTGASSVLALFWVMAAYFTVLVNLIVAVSFAAIFMTGRIGSAGWHGGLFLWIGTVGLIYHTILAGIWAPQGLGWWADQGLHTAVPLLCLIWWVRCAPKSPLTRWHPLRWAVVPLAYCIYALLRGQMTGVYAYPFIDVGVLGVGRTALNVAMLTLGFVFAGYGVVVLARVLPDQASPS